MSSLDATQLRALKAFRSGQSLAIIGGAGCGKSFLLRRLIREAQDAVGNFPTVAACAPTNRVADKLQGTTVHSLFAGLPFWRWSKEHLWRLLSRRPDKLEALRSVRVLFIDEICLVTAGMLDAIDYVLRRLALEDEDACLPFGGRQVVFAGDAFQFLPCPQPMKNEASGYSKEETEEDRPAYMARSWFLTFGGFGSGVTVILDVNHRQAGDPSFYSILQRVREGKVTPADLRLINNSSANTSVSSRYARLCLKREQVEKLNMDHLASIQSGLHIHLTEDTFFVPSRAYLRKRLDHAAPSCLKLKKGCAILLLLSIDGMFPGTRAVIHDIVTTPCNSGISAIEVKHEKGISTVTPHSFYIRGWDTTLLAIRKQFPLLPAYAVTVHRCQGMTVPNIAMDFACAHEWKPPGMVYVALSRCTALRNMCTRDLKKEHMVVSEQPRNFMQYIMRLKGLQSRRVIWVSAGLMGSSPLTIIRCSSSISNQKSGRKRRRTEEHTLNHLLLEDKENDGLSPS